MSRSPWVNVFNVFICVFLAAPLLVVAATSFSETSFLVFPPRGFSLKWYTYVLQSGRYAEPFSNSMWIAFVTVALSVPVGTMASMAVVRHRFRGREFMQSIFVSPLIVPSLLLGIGLLMLYSRLGIPVHMVRLALAHVVLAIPYVVRTMVAGFAGINPTIEEAARTLGATPLQTFWLVTLPLLRPALFASVFFAFIISFDEVVVALFLTGPRLTTLPMLIYSDVQFNLTPAVSAVSTLLVVATVVLVLVVERVVGLRKIV